MSKNAGAAQPRGAAGHACGGGSGHGSWRGAVADAGLVMRKPRPASILERRRLSTSKTRDRMPEMRNAAGQVCTTATAIIIAVSTAAQRRREDHGDCRGAGETCRWHGRLRLLSYGNIARRRPCAISITTRHVLRFLSVLCERARMLGACSDKYSSASKPKRRAARQPIWSSACGRSATMPCAEASAASFLEDIRSSVVGRRTKGGGRA